jgi:ketosteroid isomerase-like protein
MKSIHETVKSVIQELHQAVEQKDAQRLGELAHEEVFVFGPAAGAVSVGRLAFVSDLVNLFAQVKGKELHLQPSDLRVGLCDSGRSAWFLDRFDVEAPGDSEKPHPIPVRLTGLLTLEQDWRLAAAYWSIPLRDNDYQYGLIQAGKITPGLALEERVTPAAHILAQSIKNAMTQPSTMPGLYSTRPDAFTIGSTVEEVFFGEDGRNWVKEITDLPLKFAVRGGIQAALSADGLTAWTATHVDLSGGATMPYRFFYVWLREPDGWKIVVSHDAVSIDPCHPGFEIP